MKIEIHTSGDTTSWKLVDAITDGAGSFIVRGRRDISDAEIELLGTATRILKRVLGNTVWSVLEHNYEEFVRLERELLSDTDEPDLGVEPAFEPVQISVVASIVNFLTAMRMFLDQTSAELKRLDRKEGVCTRYDLWNGARERERDQNFGFGFLETFRNYVQHIGLPLSIWETSRALDESGKLAARVLLGESPDTLLKQYNEWKDLTEVLRSRTAPIDLSEQIHMAMKCLVKLKKTYEACFYAELRKSVNAYRAILGDIHSYEGRPLVARFQSLDTLALGSELQIASIEVDMTRFKLAEMMLARSAE